MLPPALREVVVPVLFAAGTTAAPAQHWSSSIVRFVHNASDAYDDQQQSPAWQRARRSPYALGLVGSAQNLVRSNSAGVGEWGGSCLCPNGQIYEVGDWKDRCGSLACIGGLSGTCHRRKGAWSGRSVECDPNIPPAPICGVPDNPAPVCEAVSPPPPSPPPPSFPPCSPPPPLPSSLPPPPNPYFLASGHQSCTDACEAIEQVCDLDLITAAAATVNTCKATIDTLGLTYDNFGMYPDDDSGCTYGDWGGEDTWAQVLNSNQAAVPAPTCDEVNGDSNRRRVCACKSESSPALSLWQEGVGRGGSEDGDPSSNAVSWHQSMRHEQSPSRQRPVVSSLLPVDVTFPSNAPSLQEQPLPNGYIPINAFPRAQTAEGAMSGSHSGSLVPAQHARLPGANGPELRAMQEAAELPHDFLATSSNALSTGDSNDDGGDMSFYSISVPNPIPGCAKFDAGDYGPCTPHEDNTPIEVGSAGRDYCQGCCHHSFAIAGSGHIATSSFKGCSGLYFADLADVLDVCPEAFEETDNLFSVNMRSVVTVAPRAFYKAKRLTTAIMANVEEVGVQAFERTHLTEANVSIATTIGDRAFAECHFLHYVNMAHVITVAEEAFVNDIRLQEALMPIATCVGDRAFENCSSLKTINVAHATIIGNRSFYKTNVSVADMTKAETIGYQAFKYARNLAHINVAKAVSIGIEAFYQTNAMQANMTRAEYVGERAFENCVSLEHVEMLVLEEIANFTFKNCPSLYYVKMPNVEIIGDQAFYNCDSLIGLPDREAAKLHPGSYLLPTMYGPAVDVVGNEAFRSADNLRAVNFPVARRIGNFSFDHCRKLRFVSTPMLITLGNSAFYECFSLEEIWMPKLEFMGESAFLGSKKLVSARLPQLRRVPYRAFMGSESLLEVWVMSADVISSQAFRDCTGLIKIDMTTAVKIGRDAFRDAKSLKRADMPNVVEIAEDAFHCCTSLEQVDISVCKYVSERAFQNTIALIGIKMPEVRRIENWGFKRAESLLAADMPMAKYLGREAFYGAKSLEYVTVEKVEVVGAQAFAHAESLREIFLPVAHTVHWGAFEGCFRLEKAVIPTIAKVDHRMFKDDLLLKEANFALATEIFQNAFENCSCLEAISIPMVFRINDYAFLHALTLSFADMPQVQVIGYGAFENASSLELLSAPHVRIVEDYAFSGATSLTRAIFPTAYHIGEGAFRNAYNLRNVHIPNTSRILDNAFEGCDNIETLVVSNVTWTWYLRHQDPFIYLECTNEAIVDPSLAVPEDTHGSPGENHSNAVVMVFCRQPIPGEKTYGRKRPERPKLLQGNGGLLCEPPQSAPPPPPVNKVIDNAPNTGSWGGRCTCPNGEAYQVGDNDDACHSLACVNGRPGACFKRPAGSDGEHRRVICVSHPFAATSELSQLDHAPKPCPPCDHSCIEDPITGMALRGEDWHEMAFDTRPFGGADR